ncbi:hypothetical protein ACP4OV_031105 [Aristida adscensionis]
MVLKYDRAVPFQWCQDLPWEGYQIYPCRFTGLPFFELEVQALLPQPSEASQAHMDSHVKEAAQEVDIHAEAVKKRRRTTKKPYSRSIVGATLEVIQKKRSEKPEVRDAAREAALREIKEHIKKTKDEKKAKKAEMTKSQKTAGKGNVPKPGKGPKLGGGGGKR